MKKIILGLAVASLLTYANQLIKEELSDFENACKNGDFASCNDLGVYSLYGANGVTQDIAKAIKLFEKVCDGGEYTGCSNLGSIYYNGYGVKQNYKKALELYSKACDGGEYTACSGGSHVLLRTRCKSR